MPFPSELPAIIGPVINSEGACTGKLILWPQRPGNLVSGHFLVVVIDGLAWQIANDNGPRRNPFCSPI
jgi:hypothetical protein